MKPSKAAPYMHVRVSDASDYIKPITAHHEASTELSGSSGNDTLVVLFLPNGTRYERPFLLGGGVKPSKLALYMVITLSADGLAVMADGPWSVLIGSMQKTSRGNCILMYWHDYGG